MHDAAIGGAGFLIAVLWFDLMFDVQAAGYGGGVLPEPVLQSIGFYYRRVTTDARPMNRLVSVAMLVTLCATGAELLRSPANPAFVVLSLICVLGAIALVATRTLRYAVALGRGDGPIELRSELAHAVYRDHVICLAAMIAFCVLQAADRLVARH